MVLPGFSLLLCLLSSGKFFAQVTRKAITEFDAFLVSSCDAEIETIFDFNSSSEWVNLSSSVTLNKEIVLSWNCTIVFHTARFFLLNSHLLVESDWSTYSLLIEYWILFRLVRDLMLNWASSTIVIWFNRDAFEKEQNLRSSVESDWSIHFEPIQ